MYTLCIIFSAITRSHSRRKPRSEVLKIEEQKVEQADQNGTSHLLESSSSSSSSSSIEICEDLDIGTLGSKMKDTESDEEEAGEGDIALPPSSVAKLQSAAPSLHPTGTHQSNGRSGRKAALVHEDSQGEAVEEKDILELAEMEPADSDEELPDKRSARLRLPANNKPQREQLRPQLEQHPHPHLHPHHHRSSTLEPFFDRKDVVVPMFVKVHKHHHHHQMSRGDMDGGVSEGVVKFDGANVDLGHALPPKSRTLRIIGGVKTWARDFRALVR